MCVPSGRFFDGSGFQQVLIDWYAGQVYRKAREDDVQGI